MHAGCGLARATKFRDGAGLFLLRECDVCGVAEVQMLTTVEVEG